MASTAKIREQKSYLNLNWRIKVSGINGDVKLNTLVGVDGLINLIGEELANNLFERADQDNSQKTICKLRRGLKITFYAK